jgi:hypothetical protein
MRKLTKREFIKRAVEKHGSFYDYSKVSYVNARTKVCIICPVHGDFYQIPRDHLVGCNCKKCESDKLKLTPVDFISRASIIHNNFYDYSKVSYDGCNIKVCIICPVHGEFFQTPSGHLSGRGCFSCMGMNKRLTLKTFIERSNSVHRDKYNYDKVTYKTRGEKVCIICPDHGEFHQIPGNHMLGAGCPLCSRIEGSIVRKLTLSTFIERSIAVHGKGKYDYSKVNYRGERKKICIICPVHGEFFQFPLSHTTGRGCRKCYIEKLRLSTSEFISRASTVHGQGKYDYSSVQYIDGETRICIICKIHGKFFQGPETHLSGSGCPTCGNLAKNRDRRLGRDEFIRRSINAHGNKYDYSKVDYINELTKVRIICRNHGEFLQIPSDHQRGMGCRKCSCSKGEVAIEKWLVENKIYFKHYHNYSDLRGPSNRLLTFDFYVPYKNLLVEFDGEQHYKITSFGSASKKDSIEKFRNLMRNDSLKNQYCIKNNIPLLRIPYFEIKNIPEILTDNILGSK